MLEPLENESPSQDDVSPSQPSSDEPQPKRMSMRWRVAVSLGAGLLVLLLSMYIAWKQEARSWYYRFHVNTTADIIQHKIEPALAEYRGIHGEYPETLEELLALEDTSIPTNEEGRVADPHGTPFGYKVDGEDYLVTAYGEDGKPGGTWHDCDITSENPSPRESFATFYQFYFENPDTIVIWRNCSITGFIVYLLCMNMTKINVVNRVEKFACIVYTLVMLIGSTWMAVIISSLHFYDGH